MNTRALLIAAALGATIGNYDEAATEPREVALERHRRELMRWNESVLGKRPYSPEAAAFYREQRRLTKLRSRAKGHGVG